MTGLAMVLLSVIKMDMILALKGVESWFVLRALFFVVGVSMGLSYAYSDPVACGNRVLPGVYWCA